MAPSADQSPSSPGPTAKAETKRAPRDRRASRSRVLRRIPEPSPGILREPEADARGLARLRKRQEGRTVMKISRTRALKCDGEAAMHRTLTRALGACLGMGLSLFLWGCTYSVMDGSDPQIMQSDIPGGAAESLAAGDRKMQSGDFQGAEAEFTRAISVESDYPPAYVSRAYARQMQGNL